MLVSRMRLNNFSFREEVRASCSCMRFGYSEEWEQIWEVHGVNYTRPIFVLVRISSTFSVPWVSGVTWLPSLSSHSDSSHRFCSSLYILIPLMVSASPEGWGLFWDCSKQPLWKNPTWLTTSYSFFRNWSIWVMHSLVWASSFSLPYFPVLPWHGTR